MISLIDSDLFQSTQTLNCSSQCPETTMNIVRKGDKFCGSLKGLAGMTMEQVECHAIIETLLMFQGNRAKAAKKLCISEKTIYNKIRRYKLARYDFKKEASILHSSKVLSDN